MKEIVFTDNPIYSCSGLKLNVKKVNIDIVSNEEGEYFTTISIRNYFTFYTFPDYSAPELNSIDELLLYGDIKRHDNFELAYEWTKQLIGRMKKENFFSLFTTANAIPRMRDILKKWNTNSDMLCSHREYGAYSKYDR